MHTIVDAHIHLFPQRLLQAIYRWFLQRGWSLQYNETDACTLLTDLRRHGVHRAVTSCYAHKPGIARSLNDWLYALAAAQPLVLPVGTVHPDDPDPAAEARRCLLNLGFGGIKIHCDVQRIAPDDPRLFPVYETALACERPVLLHAGTGPYPAPWLGVEHFRRLMRRYPRLKVQVAHLGMWETEAFLALAERYPGVHFDLAAVTDRHMNLPVPELERILRRYPERLLYGSDYPIMETPYPSFLSLLTQFGLTEQERRLILRRNAEALWGVKDPGRSHPPTSSAFFSRQE